MANISLYKEITDGIDGMEKTLISFLNREGSNVYISNKTFMEIYSKINSYVHSQEKFLETLYNYYKEKHSSFCTNLQRQLEGKSEIEYLEAFVQVFEKYKTYVRWMTKAFASLERFYKKKTKTTFSFESIDIFRNVLYMKEAEKITKNCIEVINYDRNNRTIPGPTLQSTIFIIYEMGYHLKNDLELAKVDADYKFNHPQSKKTREVYDKHFQAYLESATSQYYAEQASSWQNLLVPNYVENAHRRLEEEEARSDKYYSWSKEKVIEKTLNELVKQQADRLANDSHSGILKMLQGKQERELSGLFLLMSRVQETIIKVSAAFGLFIENVGGSMVENLTPEKLSEVIEFKSDIDRISREIFQDHKEVNGAKDFAVRNFINKPEDAPKVLAVLMDEFMRKTCKDKADQENSREVTKFVDLFRYMNTWDVFFIHYSRLLGRRLLNQTSQNTELEKQIVTLFHEEAGEAAVSKLKNMFQDMESSTKLKEDFDRWVQEKPMNRSRVEGVELNIKVLTGSAWVVESSNAILPSQLMTISKIFDEFYTRSQGGRKLKWLMSTTAPCDVTAKFTKSTKILEVNHFQMAILFVLDNFSELAFEKIQELTKIGQKLKANLKPFLLKGILLCSNGKKTGEVGDKDVIRINYDFQDKVRRLRMLPRAEKKETTEEEKRQNETEKELKQQRMYIIDSNVVRIMKARKTMNYNELFSETFKAIQSTKMFELKKPDFNERISDLIKRDFIERDQNNMKTLIYKP